MNTKVVGDHLKRPGLCINKRLPVGRKFVTILEELQVTFDEDTDLNEFTVRINADTVSFRLLYFDSFFQDDDFIVFIDGHKK